MRHFGIIGYPLDHSFSAEFFNKKFADEGIDAEYSLYPIDSIEKFPLLLRQLDHPEGLNVTMPYKQAVIPFLDELDESAREVGAVNVVHHTFDGRLIGYNTDAIGFIESLRPALRPDDRRAIVLGTGGAAKAVTYGLRQLGIKPTLVSRRADTVANAPVITYDDLIRKPELMREATIIINCTPLGMHPHPGNMPSIPYDRLNSQYLVYDCIYNPEETLFLREARLRGCKTINGIEMLYGQARAAWTIWNNQQLTK